jgi:hypothetical protein
MGERLYVNVAKPGEATKCQVIPFRKNTASKT